MKQLYILFIALIVAESVSAQNLNGRTITLVGDSTVETGVVRVNNLTSNPLSIKVKRKEVGVVPGTINYFCWTVCYGPATNVSPSPIVINPSSYSDDFHGYYESYHMQGETTVSYIFYNTANPNDSAWFTVNYKIAGTGDTLSDPFIDLNFTTGINEAKIQVTGPAYPNPSTDAVSFNLFKNEKVERVEVINMLGKTVLQQQITEGAKLMIPVNKLSDGIYFCNFYRNGAVVSTERFSVVH